MVHRVKRQDPFPLGSLWKWIPFGKIEERDAVPVLIRGLFTEVTEGDLVNVRGTEGLMQLRIH